jgi:DNA-binding SARP family transcriptional activator
MVQFSVNTTRLDPYKNFKFRVKWDNKYVAGISKVSALRRTTEVVEHRDGGFACPARTGRPRAAAGSLWPDSSEAHAQAGLRTTLWRAGRACPGLIVTGGPAMRLDSRVSVDVDELQALSRRLHVRRPAQAEDEGSWVPPRGVLLPGWYHEWVAAVRERVRQLQLHTVEAMAERQLDQGAYGRALDLALAAVEYEPLRESSQRLVVRIHLAEGNLVEAVRAVHAFTELLWQEIKVRPSAEFTGLVEFPAPS